MAGVPNYRSHLKGKPPEEVAEYYDQWADNFKYDQEYGSIYNGPTYIADEMADCYPKIRDEIKIIDIACGTGLIGEKEGLILIAMRKEYLDDITWYVNRLEPFFSKLEQENKIQILERRQVANYYLGNDGILLKIRVKKNGV